MAADSVPFATRLPSTIIEKFPPNLTSTAGSIVKVTWGLTVMSFETTNGLSTKVQIVSLSIGPSMYVALTSRNGILKEKKDQTNAKVSKITNGLDGLFMVMRPYAM